MSEYDDNNFTGDEIDRIQQDIDRDLNDFTPLYGVPVSTGEVSESTGETPEPIGGTPESTGDIPLDSQSVPLDMESIGLSIPVTPIAGEPLEAPEHETFYRETIKNESNTNSKNRFKRTVAVVAVVSILGGLFGGLGYSIGPSVYKTYFAKSPENVLLDETAVFTFSDEAEKTEATLSKDSASKSPSYVQGLPNFVDIVKSVEPAVVNISTKTLSNNNFFDMPIEQPSAATGIIFNKDDNLIYIVTNAHVVSGANSVLVSIEGNNPVGASPIGADVQADLAVISVKRADLKAESVDDVQIAKFGDSDDMEVGEWVLAIGNALGEGNTATAGIVSAKDKKINIQDRVLTVIQTNAAINPGNSGGPLVNMNGEVIGINTAKLAESASYSSYKVEGMGYSITSNKAKPIIEELMNRTTKPFLGIQGQDITEEISKMYDLPTLGVFVSSVIKDSAAEAAGILRTDIITSFNGKAIFTMEQLSEYIKQCKVGEKVEIKLIRNGNTQMSITVTLAQFVNDNF